MLETGVLYHGLDRRNGDSRARTETRRGDAGREAALVRKPLESIADAGAVHSTGTDARNDHAEIIAVKSCCVRSYRPTGTAEDATGKNHKSRPVFVNKPTLQRNKPSFENNEECKC